MEIERIRELASPFLVGAQPGTLLVQEIEKGGSGRSFFRITDPANDLDKDDQVSLLEAVVAGAVRRRQGTP